MSSAEKQPLVLPTQVTGRVDVGRLLREVEGLEDFMQQAAIRQPGTAVKMPKTSRLLDELLTTNQLNMLHEQDRKQLLTFLTTVKARSPIMHMSFGADPSPLFLTKLVTWLRSEIHPLLLLQVGLQPNIGAGAIMRTTNKQFDFSLRQRFKKQRDALVQHLHTIPDRPAPVVSAPVAPAAAAPAAQPAAIAPIPQPTTDDPAQLAQIVESAIAQMQQPAQPPAQPAPPPPPQATPPAPTQPTPPPATTEQPS